METTEEQGKDVKIQCSTCSNPVARCWCMDCKEVLCDECVSAHRRVTVTRSHQILNQPPTMVNVSTLPTKFCRVHPSEPLKLFCVTCRVFTCRDCQLKGHMNHRYYFTDELILDAKKKMEDLRVALKAKIDRVRTSLQDMETRLQDISESKAEVTSQLQDSHNKICQAITKRVQDLFKATKALSELETKTIRERMEKLKKVQIEHQSLLEAAEKAQSTNNVQALLRCTDQIKSQLNLSEDTSPPAEMTNIIIVTSRQMLDILLDFGKLHAIKVPFSVTRTPNQSTDPPPGSNPLSVHLGTYMDSRPAPPALTAQPAVPALTAPPAGSTPSVSIAPHSLGVIIGDDGKEIYKEAKGEDAQTALDDVTDDATGVIMDDVTYDDEDDESLVTLQIITCCVCGARYGSIVCSSCGLGFHRDCHLPPIGPELRSEWNCSLCQNLCDASDPFSSDRAEGPESLSLKEQRACETLLLRLKIEGSTRLSQSASVWSHVESISQRLSQCRTPHYKTTAEFVRDIMGVFKNLKDDKFSQKLRELYKRSVKDMLMVVYPTSDRASRGPVAELKVTEQGANISQDWLKRPHMMLQESRAKRAKTDHDPPHD